MHTVQPNAVFQFVSISQKYAIENHFPRIPRFSAFFNQSDIPDRTAHGRDAAICASAGYAVCPSGFSRKEHAGQPRPSCCGGGIGAFTLDLRHRVHPILLYITLGSLPRKRRTMKHEKAQDSMIIGCVTHSVFFLGISENAFNRLRAKSVILICL